MLPSFVDCPAGNEKGSFIALDLGGTNFRVLLVSLDDTGLAKIEKSRKFVIPISVTTGEGEALFNFIAASIRDFLFDQALASHYKSLGFTFSFPVTQSSVNSGRLLTWTKGFTATGVVGCDVVQLLTEALHRYHLDNIHITALVNDTVGTLLAKSYEIANCDVGVIFGTGTNGCYRERVSSISAVPTSSAIDGHMIVNTEWGNFNCLPMNKFDRVLDEMSKNPGKQQMEKMISGMYLGQLVRQVIIDQIHDTGLFSGEFSIFTAADLQTHDISNFQSDTSADLVIIKAWLDNLGITHSSVKERADIRQICQYVSERAAKISAAAISAVVLRMDPQLECHHTIAVDGTLYAKYPDFKQTIIKTLQALHGVASRRFSLTQSTDGSGVGAAIAAAVASQP